MNKKYYYIIIVCLIILNIFSWRLWWEKPPFPPVVEQEKFDKNNHRDNGVNKLYEELSLTESQKNEFESLRKEYFDKVSKINKELDELRRELSNNNDKINDSLFEEMGIRKTLLEKETFMHFRSLRDVCNEDQKVKFDTVHKRMMNRFNRRFHKRKD